MAAWHETFFLDGELVSGVGMDVLAGLLTGDGVFTTVRVCDGRAYLLDAHLARLAQSAGIVALDLPEREKWVAWVEQILKVNEVDSGKLKLCVTRNHERGSSVMILTGDHAEISAEVGLVTSEYRVNERSPLSGAKSMSYGAYLMAHPRGSASGSEVLLANSVGDLCEGTFSNVFCVFGERILTPPLSSGCLPGVTRQEVLEICEAEGIDCTESDVEYGRLQEADEIFISSSLGGVRIGTDIDGRELGRRGIGARIRELYQMRLS